MELVKRLSDVKQEMVREWIRKTMDSYPTEALNVFNRNKDKNANPLPHIISKNIELLFEELLHGISPEKTAPILGDIVRLKAVQDFIPSDALKFVFELKPIIREHFKDEIGEKNVMNELWKFEQEIDKLAGMAFDLYVKSREKLFEIRANEIKNQTHMLIRRVNEMDKQKEAR